MLKLKLVTHWK